MVSTIKQLLLTFVSFFSFSAQEIDDVLTRSFLPSSLQEVVILSTCNRVEVCAYAQSETEVVEWFCAQKNVILTTELNKHMYILSGMAAVSHVMRVACGLDSLILGEPEIFGQVKTAFALACLHKTVGPYLSRLFRQTFSVAKQIRSATKIGACPVSVASTAVHYAAQWLRDQKQPRILIIGVGSVGKIVAKRAQSLTSYPLWVMSRRMNHADAVAKEVGGIALEFSVLQDYIGHADIVISATASKELIITPALVVAIDKPTLFIDLAVPRDISPDIMDNPYVHLCQLDQLKAVIQHHVHQRSHAALQAEKIIEDSTREFMLSLRRFSSDEVIRRYRESLEDFCETEIEKVRRDNVLDQATMSMLRKFSRRLLNKIMHSPSTSIQRASIEGRDDVVTLAAELFGAYGDKIL
ncbi:MAG: glutamyl-tRNA reductase [Gammaproteobacteria bacterium]|nr:glutamyl-tRNA reductase [Gammaproteobacteria bacterium]